MTSTRKPDATTLAGCRQEGGEGEAKQASTLVIFEKQGPLGLTFGSDNPSGWAQPHAYGSSSGWVACPYADGGVFAERRRCTSRGLARRGLRRSSRYVFPSSGTWTIITVITIIITVCHCSSLTANHDKRCRRRCAEGWCYSPSKAKTFGNLLSRTSLSASKPRVGH